MSNDLEQAFAIGDEYHAIVHVMRSRALLQVADYVADYRSRFQTTSNPSRFPTNAQGQAPRPKAKPFPLGTVTTDVSVARKREEEERRQKDLTFQPTITSSAHQLSFATKNCFERLGVEHVFKREEKVLIRQQEDELLHQQAAEEEEAWVRERLHAKTAVQGHASPHNVFDRLSLSGRPHDRWMREEQKRQQQIQEFERDRAARRSASPRSTSQPRRDACVELYEQARNRQSTTREGEDVPPKHLDTPRTSTASSALMRKATGSPLKRDTIHQRLYEEAQQREQQLDKQQEMLRSAELEGMFQPNLAEARRSLVIKPSPERTPSTRNLTVSRDGPAEGASPEMSKPASGPAVSTAVPRLQHASSTREPAAAPRHSDFGSAGGFVQACSAPQAVSVLDATSGSLGPLLHSESDADGSHVAPPRSPERTSTADRDDTICVSPASESGTPSMHAHAPEAVRPVLVDDSPKEASPKVKRTPEEEAQHQKRKQEKRERRERREVEREAKMRSRPLDSDTTAQLQKVNYYPTSSAPSSTTTPSRTRPPPRGGSRTPPAVTSSSETPMTKKAPAVVDPFAPDPAPSLPDNAASQEEAPKSEPHARGPSQELESALHVTPIAKESVMLRQQSRKALLESITVLDSDGEA